MKHALRSTLALVMTLFSVSVLAAAQDAPDAQRGWIGITFRNDEGGQQPIEVAEVMPDAPAEAAGLRAGDRILSWNGRRDVSAAVREEPLRVGDRVEIRVARPGEAERELTIVATRMPAYAQTLGSRLPRITWVPRSSDWGDVRVYRFDNDSLAFRMDSLTSELRMMLRDSLGPTIEMFRYGAPEFRALPRDTLWAPFGAGSVRILTPDSVWARGFDGASLGMALTLGRNAVAGAELTDITAGLATYFGTDQGVLVLRVAPETPAARAGLQDGDVIVSAGREPISDIEELRWALSRPNARDVELQILRQGTRQTLTLRR